MIVGLKAFPLHRFVKEGDSTRREGRIRQKAVGPVPVRPEQVAFCGD